ncbi:snapalysin family zinc-dependent metalloprotease [Lentzea sp. JNUCC 0626]|uniref:snapalysin family zinc-dependent metalloprotease n=1 Tax=Lentzea sp. JNUCC 0626 TaxID=3367513 RepID=UPI0037490A18
MYKRALSTALTAAALAVTFVPAQATAAEALATTLYYTDSQAAEFRSVIPAGVAAWNNSVRNVRVVRATAGQRVDIRFVADPGWPRAELGPVRPGRGPLTVWMGRAATAQGHDATRIASHELGHVLGLPDIKPGPCSSLMSGSTAGTSCTNPLPDAREKASVERNYAGTAAPAGITITDAAF